MHAQVGCKRYGFPSFGASSFRRLRRCWLALSNAGTGWLQTRGIDLLMHVYKNEFKNLGGYLVDMQRVDDPIVSFIELERVEKFILSVGSYEEQIFKKRSEIRRNMLKGIQSANRMLQMVENTKELLEELKNNRHESSDTFRDSVLSIDKIKLGCSGWKQRYYKEKFLVEDPKETEILRKEIVREYTEGLCWVLVYYFSGIPSWNWYYPYYYVPCASELKGLAEVNVNFDKGSPFKPVDQLMAVLPPKRPYLIKTLWRLRCGTTIGAY